MAYQSAGQSHILVTAGTISVAKSLVMEREAASAVVKR